MDLTLTNLKKFMIHELGCNTFKDYSEHYKAASELPSATERTSAREQVIHKEIECDCGHDELINKIKEGYNISV